MVFNSVFVRGNAETQWQWWQCSACSSAGGAELAADTIGRRRPEQAAARSERRNSEDRALYYCSGSAYVPC